MEVALGVEALEAVGAEEVALRLDQVGGAAGLAVAVEIGERRGERRHRQAVLSAPPATTRRSAGVAPFIIATKPGPSAGW